MMDKRRVHSSIDRLPAHLQDSLRRMIVDNEYPYDFAGQQDGTPRYEDLVDYCRHQGHKISPSAIGRYGKRMRTLARMKQAGMITREVMSDLTEEKASQTQKAVAEMITAVVIDYVSGTDNITPKQIKDLACTVKDCTAIAIKSDQYVREQLETKAEVAAESTKEKLKKAGVDNKLIQEIVDEHLGVVKS
ncbi:MAG: DUF3486 family protein [Planctomycetes bacterium]|nr:DUF3486 family protein [Planctomycetota bacterium]